MEILKFINTLISYLASREVNYNTKTLIDLYENENKLQKQILEIHSNPDFSPNGVDVLVLINRLRSTKSLIEVLESKTFPNQGG